MAAPLRLAKNDAHADGNRAAGELEGARPTSNTRNRRPENLDHSRFSGYQHFA